MQSLCHWGDSFIVQKIVYLFIEKSYIYICIYKTAHTHKELHLLQLQLVNGGGSQWCKRQKCKNHQKDHQSSVDLVEKLELIGKSGR